MLIVVVGLTFLGYPKEARKLIERAVRLNPAEELGAYALSSFVHFELGEFEESIALAERHSIGTPWVDFAAFQAAAHHYLGNAERMQECWGTFLQEFAQKINGGRPADSRTAVEWMVNINPYRGPSKMQPFWEFIGNVDMDDLKASLGEEAKPEGHCFLREGDLWTVRFEGKEARLPDLKGHRDLSRLLSQPGESVHCTELMGARVLAPGEEVFDDQARSAYRSRIHELKEDMEDARSNQDGERLEELQEAYDELVAHLSRITGKGGESRKVSGTVEKCRAAATWRIRSAIKKIAEVHPSLGQHLETSVKTGIFCEYAPDQPLKWRVKE